MKDRETTLKIISAQNQILVLSETKDQISKELIDIKDLMRKIREQEIKFGQSTYCFTNGIGLKKKPKQIYPHLEKKSRQLTLLKSELDSKLTTELKVLIQLMKNQKLVGGELDGRVNKILKDYELTIDQD